MTGRTHDLTALTLLNIVVATSTVPKMSVATALVAISACAIGGLAPDIDQPTAALWRRLPIGTFWGQLLSPLFGKHRFISHSIVGIILFGILSKFALILMSTFVLVDIDIVWWAFMIGFLSHLLIDSITREGVPWLFPIPWRIGFPPVRALRMKTGGFIEKLIIFPGLVVLNGLIIAANYEYYVTGIKKFLHS